MQKIKGWEPLSKMIIIINAYRGVRGEGREKQKTVTKNAIKPKIGDTPGNFFRKALIPPPPRDFIKSLSNPLPMDFEHVCIYDKNGLSNYLHTFKNP
jgi:hypothetical protein